jgi:hypothetical protein
MKKEVTMYKLAIVGIVLSGVLMSAAIAQAKPVGMSKAENRALVIRSEGLNHKYGVGQKSQQAIIREKLGEIGAWAVPSTSTTSTPTPVVSSDDGFGWNNAGIGAVFVLGAMLLGVASLATRRRHHRPLAH